MRAFLVSILFFPCMAAAQLQLASVFSDNMVLQREKPIYVWGTGVPGSHVTVSFRNEKEISIVRSDSSWRVAFKKQKVTSRPQTLMVSSGADNIMLKNILVGDVWLCIGQSNMEWPMAKEKHFREALGESNQPLLRFYNPTYVGKNIYGKNFPDSTIQQLNTKDFYTGHWRSSDSNSIRTMSAIGYYFGKKILNEIKVPIGLINLAIGGAPIETFIDKETMLRDKRFAEKARGNWLTNDNLPVWVRERGAQNVGASKRVLKDDLGPNHAFKPGFAYANGIEPILSFPISGILWYQGESNAQEIERVEEYGALLQLMVDDYRRKWDQPSLPFFFVQLSSIDTINYRGHLWPYFRDEQRKCLQEIKHSGMAVCSDLGERNDVHPTNKKDVGERLAKWALNKTYKKQIAPSGPLPVTATYQNESLTITFEYAGEGLQTKGNKPVTGFSTDGKNPVEALIQGETVVISVSEKPDFVYYGWEPFTEANLLNRHNLPASTFKLKVQ